MREIDQLIGMTLEERDGLYRVSRAAFAALILGLSLYSMFGGLGRSLVLIAGAFLCMSFEIGARWVLRSSAVAFIVAALVAFELAPSPSTWAKEVRSVAMDVAAIKTAGIVEYMASISR